MSKYVKHESMLADAPHSLEHYAQRVGRVLNSTKFREAADEVGSYTQNEGREAGLAVYGYAGPAIDIATRVPDPNDPYDNMFKGMDEHYTAFSDPEGTLEPSLNPDLLLAAHTHPVRADRHPMDVFLPSQFDIEGDEMGRGGWQEQWMAFKPSHPRLLDGIIVRKDPFNKMLLVNRSPVRPFVPRYQARGYKIGTNRLHETMRQSGLNVVTLDLSLGKDAHREQVEQVVRTLVS